MTDHILEVRYETAAEIDDEVQGRLFLAGCAGSRILEDGLNTIIEAFFSDARSRDEAADSFDGLAVRLTPADRPRLDWLTLYEQSLSPILIGRRFVVAPNRILIEQSERLAIVVPQELAFGTGSHETTALCLEELERIDIAGRLCADIGTGSGILAVAMLLLGARKVVAFDNDPDAFAPIRDNMRRNDIALDQMLPFIGSLEALRGTFALVTMNIIPEVILPLLPMVVRRMRSGADLILSGILTVRRDEIVEASAVHGLELASDETKGEWWCGRFTRKTNGSQPRSSKRT